MQRSYKHTPVSAALLLCIALALFLSARLSSWALSPASKPPLGTAAQFAVLGAVAVTNTGATKIIGDLGVSPGTSCTGLPSPCIGGGPGMVNGSIHLGDPAAATAQADAHTAYANAQGQTCTTNLTGQDLGGLTLTPGVYCFDTSAQLTGTLTLSGTGVFIFQVGSTLTTATSSAVVLKNGTPPCNHGSIFWQVGSAATLGTGTHLIGNVLAESSITAVTGASSSGSLYALTGAVTLDTNTVNTCSGSTPSDIGRYPADGAFVLGDVSANASLSSDSPVTWWSTNWSKLNSLSGGPAPARYGGTNSPLFEGFVSVDNPKPACGVTWSDTPEEPPPTHVPQYMLVVVTNKITHTGTNTLSGKITEIVIVKTNPGYNGQPNTPGTGTVVGAFCQGS